MKNLIYILIGLSIPIVCQGQHLDEIKKITPNDPDSSKLFGISVDINGNIALIGTRSDSCQGAYIFYKNEGGINNWGEIKKLIGSDSENGDRFGSAVSTSSNKSIVGSYLSDCLGENCGSAYIFYKDEGGTDNWGEVKKLTASDLDMGDWFGYSVAISGDVAIVGAWQNDDNGDRSGSAYIFHKDEGGIDNWGEVKKLTASDADQNDRFGFSVDINEDVAIVGAYVNGDNGPASGSAYIFLRDQGGTNNWGEIKKLTASDADQTDWFGQDVAISGAFSIVGSRFNDDNGSQSGSAYIFGRNEGGTDNWGEVKKLTASDADEGDRFGTSVEISGNVAVVGASWNQDKGDRSGSAYMFIKNGGGENNWGEVQKIIAADVDTLDLFGHDVAASNQSIIISSVLDDDSNFENIGSAYIYDGSIENLVVSDFPIPQFDYQAQNSIQSTSLIENGTIVRFISRSVILLDGFEVQRGGLFEIIIEP